jgi:hypothetical protein
MKPLLKVLFWASLLALSIYADRRLAQPVTTTPKPRPDALAVLERRLEHAK